MVSSITYGQLYDKLQKLGYGQEELDIRGKQRYIFEHKTVEHARIILPVRPTDEIVEEFYKNAVRGTLKVHQIVHEPDLLDFVPNNSNNRYSD